MSGELVPLDEYRQAFNEEHGTQLVAHNTVLKAGEARAINEAYNLEVYLGNHGNMNELAGKPLQAEYEAVDEVIDHLHPGDVLFVEQPGFMQHLGKVPAFLADPATRGALLETAALADLPNAANLRESIVAYEELINAETAALAEAPLEHRITTWEYAARRALLKGVEVRYADYDAFELERAEVVLGKKIFDIIQDPDVRGQALAAEEHRRREQKAFSMEIDFARQHLGNVQAEQRLGVTRKPTLALLYGIGHENGFRELYDRAHLQAAFVILHQPQTLRERAWAASQHPADYDIAIALAMKIFGGTTQAQTGEEQQQREGQGPAEQDS